METVGDPTKEMVLVLEGKLRLGTSFNSLARRPVAHDVGLLSQTYGLLWGIAACYFGPPGFPGTGHIRPKAAGKP